MAVSSPARPSQRAMQNALIENLAPVLVVVVVCTITLIIVPHCYDCSMNGGVVCRNVLMRLTGEFGK